MNRFANVQMETRFIRGAFLFFTLLLFAEVLSAQKKDTSALEKGPVRWLQVEKSFGVVPEIDFVNGAMGINISRGKFIRGTQRAMAGTTYSVGYAYDTDHQVSYANFGASLGYFKRKFGLQVAVKGLYYVKKSEHAFGIRPEAGIGFPKANLLYGYNFIVERSEQRSPFQTAEIMQLPKHTLTLYVYFGIHSTRTAMY